MLIAWAFCNRGTNPADRAIPTGAGRLSEPDRQGTLAGAAPGNARQTTTRRSTSCRSKLRPELARARCWSRTGMRSHPNRKSERVAELPVVQGAGDAGGLCRDRLGDLWTTEPLWCSTTRGTTAYRPAPLRRRDEADGRARRLSARRRRSGWGLDRINAACGIGLCVDLSATPFYLHGSGYPEGSPFPWMVSDFGLVDAIESGIVKIPRLPVIDNTGRPDPKYFKLWDDDQRDLQPAREARRREDPSQRWYIAKAEDALLHAGRAVERAIRATPDRAAGPGPMPPVLIVVCDNTDIAEDFYREDFSGEEEVDADDPGRGDEEEDAPRRQKKKGKRQKHYGARAAVFPELCESPRAQRSPCASTPGCWPKAESEDPKASQEGSGGGIAEDRRNGRTPGGARRARPLRGQGEHADRRLGREQRDPHPRAAAFGSQLLCEQVVGRGLRRMDYTPDPETGRLTAEYVDIYGVPFSLIPFKGREPGKGPLPEDRPEARGARTAGAKAFRDSLSYR